HPARPVRRLDPPARRGPLGRAGRPPVPRARVPGRGERAPRGRARRVRSDVSGLLGRQTDAAEAAPRRRGAAGRRVLPAYVPRHAAEAGGHALLAAPPVDARRRRGAGSRLVATRRAGVGPPSVPCGWTPAPELA